MSLRKILLTGFAIALFGCMSKKEINQNLGNVLRKDDFRMYSPKENKSIQQRAEEAAGSFANFPENPHDAGLIDTDGDGKTDLILVRYVDLRNNRVLRAFYRILREDEKIKGRGKMKKIEIIGEDGTITYEDNEGEDGEMDSYRIDTSRKLRVRPEFNMPHPNLKPRPIRGTNDYKA